MGKSKLQWQRENRAQFRDAYGYSQAAHYSTGKLRDAVLRRDCSRCVACRMTDAEHKAKWNRPITVDHKDRDRSNNTLANLQTLCLSCHGRKDVTPQLIVPIAPAHREEITRLRRNGKTYQTIADAVGLSIGCVWKWCQRWEIA